MIYILAAIGAITVAVLMWRAFGPEGTTTGASSTRPVAPDDDPDFLRRLGDQQRNKGDNPDR